MAVLRRHLDTSEAGSVDYAASIITDYDGEIDELAVAKAINAAGIQHPVLTARITADDSGYVLQAEPGSQPEFVVVKGDTDTLMGELDRRWNPSRTAVRFVLMRDGLSGSLAMQVDNSLFDGASLVGCLREVWRYYAEAVNNQISDVRQGRLPASQYKLLMERWTVGEPSDVEGLGSMAHDSKPKAAARRRYPSIRASGSLSAAETLGLVSSARNCGVSVHGIVAGTALRALRCRSNHREATKMYCWTQVDLRSRVTPRVGATDVTHFQSVHVAEVVVAEDLGATEIGKDVQDQLKAGIESRKLRLPGALSGASASTTRSRRFHEKNFGISSAGVIAEFPHPTDVAITGLRFTRCPYTPARFPVLACWTYGDRMSFTLWAPADRFDSRRISGLLDDILQGLREFGHVVEKEGKR